MKRLHYWLIVISAWFFLLYNIERLSQPVNLASFVYIYTAVWAVLLLMIPPLYRLPLYWPFILALPPYFVVKNQLGYHFTGAMLPITITEIVAIGLTIILIGQMARGLDELRKAVINITIAPLNRGTYLFEEGQGRIYREIRRARHYHRPAALLAISVDNGSYERSLDKFTAELQEALLQEYVNARIANFLISELQDYAVITRRDDHFITLLPEAGHENIVTTINELQAAAEEKLGLKIHIGCATFPDEAVTFERLLERAETKMEAGEPICNGQVQQATEKTTEKAEVLQV